MTSKHPRWSYLLVVARLATLAGCAGDGVLPQAPSQPTMSISDGAHGGLSLFFFLPPMVAQPATTGSFDPSLSPTVLITENGLPLIQLAASVHPEDEAYQANWNTDPTVLDPDKAYRITVIVNGTTLGFADVDVVSRGSELRNVATGENVRLLNGRTLPIRFRIEHSGALTLSIVEGDGLSAIVGTPTAVAPLVRVIDALGAPRAGVTVTFAQTAGFSGLAATTATSDADGLASPGAWLLHSPGAHALSAAAPAATPVTLAATARHLVWRTITGIPGENFRGVYASSTSDIWVSGGYRSLSHSDGAIWSASPHPSGANRYHVFGLGPNAVFSAGQAGFQTGNVMFYNGTSWSTIFTAPTELFATWASSPTEAFVIGDGTMYRLSGGTWSPIATNLNACYQCDRLEHVWGTSPTNVWAGGSHGNLLHYDGAAVTNFNIAGAFFSQIHGTSATDVWAVGSGVFHWDGASWTTIDTGLPPFVAGGVCSISPNNVYVLGVLGRVIRFDGHTWSEVPTGLTARMQECFALDATHIYSGADGPGTLLVGEP